MMNIFIENNKTKNIDILLCLIVALILFCFNYLCLGFAKSGISVPFSYRGGDDFVGVVYIKAIIENGWIGKNNFIGAPFGTAFYDFQSNFLMNTESLSIFIISRFIKDPYTVFNIQYLWVLALCGIMAFIVLRQIGVCQFFSTIGAILYGMSPYIYSRGMGHYSLGACYFIPLSILLCVWIYEDDPQYLSLKGGVKSFLFYKKNILMFICSLVIANNGIGYYPFFTCFFLCISAITAAFNTKRFSAIRNAVITICCIVFFMFLALMPVLIYTFNFGANNIAMRSIGETEIYGLKVTQLFMPTNNHHLATIQRRVTEYNRLAPLITENGMAYLGVFACVGLLVMLVLSFAPNFYRKGIKLYTNLFTNLSIWALLFFSIGGFITLFCLITGFRRLRAFNRVSIFIEFMSIASLCLYMQAVFEIEFVKKHRVLHKGLQVLFAVFSLFCIYEQHPSIAKNSAERIYYNSLRQADMQFIQQIEEQLQENDAVFQLPYHKYPEAGPVRNMADYHLFAGYVNSSKLRWSYGGMKGRKSDKWNEAVSSLPIERRIKAIVQSGFRGIYIDSLAYTDEELKELCLQIESVLQGESPLISKNNVLLFYNLYGYCEKHPELLDLPIYDADFPPLAIDELVTFYGVQNNFRTYVISGLSGAEEGFTWTDGKKFIFQATLENINSDLPVHAFFDATVFNGTQRLNIIVNENQFINLEAQGGSPLEFDFKSPENGKVKIEVELPDAVSPKSLGLSGDSRVLALAFKTIVFTQN